MPPLCPDENIIECHEIVKSYSHSFQHGIFFFKRKRVQQTFVLNGVNLRVKRGEFVAILGVSGSGKTTILNILAGLEKVDSGEIRILNNDFNKMSDAALCDFRSQNIGYIFQSFALLDELNVIDNVTLPYLNHKFKRKEAYEAASHILLDLGIASQKFKDYPMYLSGGEQQRVAIARALILKPSILLADEPTGNLDEGNSLRIQEILKDIQKKHHLTCILVTHNLKLAKIADQILYMQYGRIQKGLIHEMD